MSRVPSQVVPLYRLEVASSAPAVPFHVQVSLVIPVRWLDIRLVSFLSHAYLPVNKLLVFASGHGLAERLPVAFPCPATCAPCHRCAATPHPVANATPYFPPQLHCYPAHLQRSNLNCNNRQPLICTVSGNFSCAQCRFFNPWLYTKAVYTS